MRERFRQDVMHRVFAIEVTLFGGNNRVRRRSAFPTLISVSGLEAGFDVWGLMIS